jgi:hypothetical protein
MSTLALALILPLLAAGAFGALLGLAAARGRGGFVSGEHPVLDALLKRRNAGFNLAVAFVAWGLVLYVIPKASFTLFGIEDVAAFGISFALQLCVLAVALFGAERVWSRIA